MTVGFINPPYSAREDEGPMIFTVGVTGDHILERDIELSFSTVDGLIAGEKSYHFFMLSYNVYIYHTHTHTHTYTHTHTHTPTHPHTHTHTHPHPHPHTHTHTHTHTDFAAMAGLDYTSIINMPIILSAGMQSIDISVELNPDQIFENNEIFQGTLAIISGERVSLSPGTANATIVEDESMYMYTHTMLYF